MAATTNQPFNMDGPPFNPNLKEVAMAQPLTLDEIIRVKNIAWKKATFGQSCGPNSKRGRKPMQETLGVSTPNRISDQIERLKAILSECQPFNSVAEEANLNFLDISLDAAQRIHDIIIEAKKIHNLA